ncbi:MAG: DUF2807 domain-containing protein [Parvularculaceae bacterium]|nr:DUF2807 domain-containing protein [Parvularculaceae bacterium]
MAAQAAPLAAQEGERVLDLDGFDKIAVAGVYDLTVVVGPAFGVRIRGPESEIDKVIAEVRRETLVLDMRDRRGANRKHRGRSLEAMVTAPQLVALDVAGVADARITGINSSLFKASMSGVGEMHLEGGCKQLSAEVSGVGELDAKRLRCANVWVQVSGIGSAGVFASEAVDASVSGMGDIRVIGSPKKVKKSGGLFADISVE